MLSINTLEGSDNEAKNKLKATLSDPTLSPIMNKLIINSRNAIVYLCYSELATQLNINLPKDNSEIYKNSLFMEQLKEIVEGYVF